MSDTAAAETANDTDSTTITIDATVPETGTDLQAEVEKWKALARKQEDRAKANATAAKELDQLRQQSMSDQEKAVDQAKAQGRAEALAEYGTKLVDAEVRAASAGRAVDIDALLEGLDRSKFIDDNGDPDRDSIAAWIDRVAPKNDDVTNFDLGQGTRGGDKATSNPLVDALSTMTGSRSR